MPADVPLEAAHPQPCRFCAANGYDAELCKFAHERPVDTVAPLATKLASIFQQRTPTDEQVGYFMQDAAAIISDFDPLPDVWRVRKLPCGVDDEFVMRFRVNDVTYVVEDAEGYNEPVRLATFRQWQRESEVLR